jgi:5'-methylthioadenosine phosphorylase
MTFAIIAGTGMYDLPNIELKAQAVTTPYGEALIHMGQGENSDVVFLSRHGPQHTVPPHRINYRANIKALEQLGVKRVIANYAVGSINPDIAPLSVVAIDDFLDFTHGRENTFYDGTDWQVKHVDISTPFAPFLREKMVALAPNFDLVVRDGGTYVCTNGPRLESPAEVRMFAQLGGDVLGMTGLPEAVLAAELGICFAGIGFSINWAAGVNEQIVVEGNAGIRAKILNLCLKTLRETDDSQCQPAPLI